ncbi:MAG: hypothetical protein GF347_01660 [Candidatus Moranbacteria bacterium]|nr:hypothetical protein [Candidatus Moranbacteria bacterium]
MPDFDGRGPMGNRMTGRGMGPCTRGMNQGFGGGRFYGRRFISDTEEKNLLQDEKEYLEKELNAVNERLSKMDTQK